MSEEYDRFADYMSVWGGSLSGDGLTRHDSVRSEVTEDGLTVEMDCRHCGKPRQMMVGWPELMAVGLQISPSHAFAGIPQLAEWASPWRQAVGQRSAYWVPEGCNCSGCGNPMQPMFSPDECKRAIALMRQKGWLSKSDEQQVGQLCLDRAGQIYGRR